MGTEFKADDRVVIICKVISGTMIPCHGMTGRIDHQDGNRWAVELDEMPQGVQIDHCWLFYEDQMRMEEP